MGARRRRSMSSRSVEQVRVGGGRVEGQHDGAGLRAAGRRSAETGPRAMSGTARMTTSASRDGAAGVGDLAARLEGALLAGRGVLDCSRRVWSLRCRLFGDAHAHLAAGADDGDRVSVLAAGHACLAPQVGEGCVRVHWFSSAEVVLALSPCQGSQCSMIWLMLRSSGGRSSTRCVVVEQALRPAGSRRG